jgi:hypothetical protein
VTFAGRFLAAFFMGAGAATAVGVTGVSSARAGVGELAAGLKTPTSEGLGDCFEQALAASSTARMAKPAIMASFCWRDQDESVVAEIVLLVWFESLLLVGFLLSDSDFQVVVMVSPPLRPAQSKVIGQESGQSCQR